MTHMGTNGGQPADNPCVPVDHRRLSTEPHRCESRHGDDDVSRVGNVLASTLGKRALVPNPQHLLLPLSVETSLHEERFRL